MPVILVHNQTVLSSDLAFVPPFVPPFAFVVAHMSRNLTALCSPLIRSPFGMVIGIGVRPLLSDFKIWFDVLRNSPQAYDFLRHT